MPELRNRSPFVPHCIPKRNVYRNSSTEARMGVLPNPFWDTALLSKTKKRVLIMIEPIPSGYHLLYLCRSFGGISERRYDFGIEIELSIRTIWVSAQPNYSQSSFTQATASWSYVIYLSVRQSVLYHKILLIVTPFLSPRLKDPRVVYYVRQTFRILGHLCWWKNETTMEQSP